MYYTVHIMFTDILLGISENMLVKMKCASQCW